MKKSFVLSIFVIVVLLNLTICARVLTAETNIQHTYIAENKVILQESYSGAEFGIGWSFDSDTGHLEIYHEGEGRVSWGLGATPWYKYRDQIKTATVSELTYISRYTFYGCYNLTSVTISDSVTTIEWNAFEGCSSLTHIEIPNSVTTIESNAFEGCSSLTHIEIPNSVTSIGNWAFKGCTSLSSISMSENIAKIDATSFEDTLFYNTETNWETIGAFYINNCLISVKKDYNGTFNIKEGTKTIASSAFLNCNNLNSIIIPNSVTNSNIYSYECNSLESIHVDNENPYYASENGVLFNKDKTAIICYPAGNNSITYDIPSSVNTLGDRSFSNCINLTYITIPNSVTSLGAYAFQNCTNLTSVTIPNSVTNLKLGTFKDCTNLTSVVIPNSIKDLSSNTFMNCTNLITVTIPYGVIDLGYCTFEGCINLESIIIPSSVTIIEYTAFKYCEKLTIYGNKGSYAESQAKYLGINFKPLDYTISYNANKGTGAPSSQTKNYNIDITLSNTIPTRTGYLFKGWATSSTATIAEYQPGDIYSVNEDIKLYAVWQNAKTYTISYNANGGTGAPSSQTKTHDVSMSISTVTPKRTGYTFKGWSTSGSASSVMYQPGGTYSSNSSVTLYAVWQINTYTVTYDANGGSNAPSTQTKTHGVSLYLSTQRPNRTGYTFKGWATSSSASIATYQPGATYSSNNSVTLYAVWQINTYTITYDANGGINAPSSESKIHGANLYISSKIPTREGYTFKGWSTSSTSSTAIYQPQDAYTTNSSIVLYAVWKVDTYTIKYDANGGTGAPEKQIKEYGQTITLSAAIPEKDGYIFKGWASLSTATMPLYFAGENYSGNSDITLYAVWQLKTYSVSYNANGGSNAPSSQIKNYFDNLALEAGTPTKEGYNFVGWSTTLDGEVEYNPGDTYSENKDIVLYAVWEILKYNVVYDANGGNDVPSVQTKTYGEPLILGSIVPVREGYTFEGWSTSSSASTAMYQPGETYSSNKEVTLYAVWQINTYSVTYDANGGSNAPSSQIKTYGEPLILSSVIPVREGYTFEGWSTSSSASMAMYQPGEIYSSNNEVTLYAVWKINTYSVAYDANGGSNAPSSQIKNYFDNLVLEAGTPTKEGYNFVGWSTTLDGEVEYNPGDTYSENKDIVLYAVWEILKYNVVYDANGGNDVPSVQTKTYGEPLILSSIVPVREGYTFEGWSTSSSASTAMYQPGETYSSNNDLTLYAVWQINTYSVTYDANGGSNAPSSQTKTYGVNLTLSDIVPTRTGYTFKGWSTSSSASTAMYHPGEIYSSNNEVTLYAVWQINTYSVVYDANGGSNAPQTQYKAHFDDLVITNSIPIKNGYTFTGWSTSSTGKVEYLPGDIYADNEAIVLYAVWEIPMSGICGENVIWSISDDYTLTISGSGAMTDYTFASDVPWYASRDKITYVIIENGVTTIGDRAFYHCSNLDNAEVPESVTSIGAYAFYYCLELDEILLLDNVKAIKASAFEHCPTEIDFWGSSIQWENIVNPSGYDAECFYNDDYIRFEGELETEAGADNFILGVHFSSSYNNDYLISTIVYPKEFTLKEVVSKDFVDNSIDTQYNDEENNYVTIISQYSYDSNKTNRYDGYNPYDLVFEVSETCPIDLYFFEFGEDTVVIGDTDNYLYCDWHGGVLVPDVLTIVGENVISDKWHYTVNGNNSNNVPVIWSVDNESIATISANGWLIPKADGMVTITAKYENGEHIFATKTVQIVDNSVTSLTIVGQTTVYDGEKYHVLVYPLNLSNKTIKWSVDNTDIAIVNDDGVLTALKPGKVTLRATVDDNDGIYVEQEITIPNLNAVVDTLSTNVGVWNKQFTPYERNYTVVVPSDTESIAFTGSFVGGSLKYNSTTMLNGRARTFTLESDITELTFYRSNVTGQNDSYYTVTVVKDTTYLFAVSTIENGKYKITVDAIKLPEGCESAQLVVAVYYGNDRLATVKKVTVTEDNTVGNVWFEYDSALYEYKVMLFDTLGNIKPLSENIRGFFQSM